MYKISKIACILLISINTLYSLEYPQTLLQENIKNYFGILVDDPYQWLENSNEPLVQEWDHKQSTLSDKLITNGENHAYLNDFFKQIQNQDEVILTYIGDTKKILVRRNHPELHAPIYYIMETPDSKEQLLLDVNQWNFDYTISYVECSPDGQYIAFGIDKEGEESPRLHLMNTDTLQPLNETVQGDCHTSIIWNANSLGFYYVEARKEHANMFFQKIRYHTLGQSSIDDILILEDHVKKDWLYSMSQSDEVLYIFRYGGDQVEGYKLPLRNPLTQLEKHFERDLNSVTKITYTFGSNNYLLTNENAPHFRLMNEDTGEEVIPETEDYLKELIGCNGKIAAIYLSKGHNRIIIFDVNGQKVNEIPLPEDGSAFFSASWDSPEAQIFFSSLIRPGTVYQYCEPENTLTLEAEYLIEGYDPNQFEVKTIEITSLDGVKVPVHLAHKKGLKHGPVYLSGYGGFDIPFPASFNYQNVPWLNSSAFVCVSHLRGGSEYGQYWHAGGMREKKQNVFNDFISISEWLTQTYTTPEQLAIYGKSNGGLLTGAAITQRPDLYGAAISTVPVLDMLRFHLLLIGSLWNLEYGNSETQSQFEYLLNYSPYHNVKEGINYPPILFTGARNDKRVHPAHARKMAARMQNINPEGRPHLYKSYEKSGHMYHSKLDNHYRIAYETAFLMDHVGIKAKPIKKSALSFPFEKKMDYLRREEHFEENISKQTLLNRFEKEFKRKHEFNSTL